MAFDTINHDTLLDKMFFYGVRGIVLDWVKNYLSNREQSVSYNEDRLTEICCRLLSMACSKMPTKFILTTLEIIKTCISINVKLL